MHIGLYFGSFNPVHIGHLAIAGYFAQFTELEQVWMVISPQNPLKEKKSLLKDHHRLAMVRAAIEDYPYLRASDVEFHLPRPSFTSHTLAYLEEKYPQHTFSLLLGSDTLETFHKWKNPEVILNRHRLYVYPRPGYDGGELRNHEKITWVEGVPTMEISATFIRQSIALKKDIRFLMPDKAWKYMTEMHFYE
jgi:nicotinate-nucleotide adenylyltransferase